MSNHTNLFKTKLVGSYTNSDTIITVEDASTLSTFPTKLVIFNAGVGDPSDAFGAGEAEIVNATGKSGNDITIQRGEENTSAVSLSSGWDVYQTITADTIDGKEPIFTKNTAFNKDFGNQADTVTEGNDERLSDARTPTEHGDEAHSENYVKDNDARLSDAREWTADTVTQNEAEAGTDTTRKAWTVQRVWQAIESWYDSLSIAISKVSGLQGELDDKANLEGGNEFSGVQIYNQKSRFKGQGSNHGDLYIHRFLGATSDLNDGAYIVVGERESLTKVLGDIFVVMGTGSGQGTGSSAIINVGMTTGSPTSDAVRGHINVKSDSIEGELVSVTINGDNLIAIKLTTSAGTHPVLIYSNLVEQAIEPVFVQSVDSESSLTVNNDKMLYSGDIIAKNRNILTELDGKLEEETGTWEPIFRVSGGFDSITYERLTARYIKKGSEVFVFGRFRTTELTKGSASGRIDLGGLPFTVNTGAGSLQGVGKGLFGHTTGWNKEPHSFVPNDTFDFCYMVDVNDNLMNVADLEEGTGVRNQCSFSFSYRTTQ